MIDTAGCRHSHRDIPDHFAFEPRPVRNRLEARQSLRFRLSPQFSY
jgi:hypothetical protein